jgi:enamidase
MKTAIVNIGAILSGEIRAPFRDGDAIFMSDGLIQSVGSLSEDALDAADVVIDAAGAVAAPGLIDSHVHITFGDYTPRQKTVGFLESYVHGGVTSAITASEVHTPGRPKDPVGVKALAVAALKCFTDYRPGGMRVHAGALILEPGLTDDDVREVAQAGLRFVKAGFGAFASPYDYVPLIESARRHGMISMVHTGGASIPGSSGIWAEHLVAMQPDISFHVNGGPIAIPEEGFDRLIHETNVAMQLCTAGNLRTALLIAEKMTATATLDRLLIATDTPTGSGIMPLGMLYTISHLVALGGMAPEIAIAAATGNNARHFKLNSGVIDPGRDADVILLDAGTGGSQPDAIAALKNGDIPSVAAVVTAGIPRFVGASRNTPRGVRNVRTARSRIVQTFDGASH